MTRFRRAAEVAAWALYDFANTIYSLNVLSYHFPLWITSDRKVPEWQFMLAMALSALASAVLMPLVGRLADRTHDRRWPLAAATVACAGSTALLAVMPGNVAALLMFSVSQALYQVALVLYNARIVHAGGGVRMGLVSGLGVAAGYLGTVTALYLIRPIAAAHGHSAAFVPTALLFLIFALPCIWIVKGEGRQGAADPVRPKLRFRQLLSMLVATPALKSFSLCSVFILNAAAIVITLMTVFAKNAAHLSEAEIVSMILLSSLTGMAGGIGMGAWYDRRPSISTVRIVPILWTVAVLLNAAFRSKACFFGAAAAGGFALGATWSVTRVYVLSIVPREELGIYYGLYGMLGRLASLTGPLAVAFLMKAFEHSGHKYDAVNLLLLLLAAGGALALFPGRQSGRPKPSPLV